MTIYRERLWPAPWLLLATALLIPATLLVFTPINIVAGAVVATMLFGACLAGLLLTAAVVEVSETEFIAGRARLPIARVGAVSTARGDEAFLERGQRLDARAWLLVRGWVDPVVRVEVDDPHDPVPYWLVSTRHPEAVTDAIAQARSRAQP